jgi:alkylation response protein AidB-like acyl-CoA dehydrogenase
MHRGLSDEDRAFAEEMREIFTTAVPAEIRDKVRSGRHATRDEIVATQQVLNAAGIAVPDWPEEHGGRGWTEVQRHIWATEMQAACVPPPLSFNTAMVGPVLAAFGTEEQQRRFLPPTANLDIWWAQGFSEPDAGSDLASLRTSAVRDGDDWIVNGQKTWTTLGQYGDWIFCLVRTDPEASKQTGISFLLIDMDDPGVTVRPIRLIDGGHEVNEVFFTDVRVPGENLVGEVDRGWDIAKFLLGNERVNVAPVGTIKRWLAAAKRHASEVVDGDGTLLDDPVVAGRVAELESETMALELTVLRVAGNSTEGRPDPASSILKLRGSELQQDVLELALDVAGPMALSWTLDGPLPDWSALAAPTYLNYRKASIYGGSNEIQRQIIAGRILGLQG